MPGVDHFFFQCLDHVGGLQFLQMEGNLGVFPGVGLQKERQQRGHHRGDDPQVEIARHRTFCLVDQVLYPHRFSDGGRGLGDDLLSERGGGDGFFVAVEDLYPEFLFEFLYLHREGRLGDEALFGCRGKTAPAGYGQDVLELD